MEAKDTVIVMLPIPTDKKKVVEAIKVQAEITWSIAKKAGIKEAVEWIEKMEPSLKSNKQWQTKKKEWGIDATL